MRKILLVSFTLLLLMSFTSCAIINALMGVDECNYPGCDRTCVKDCNYCFDHCSSYTMPGDFDKKINNSLDKQMEQYRTDQKNSMKNSDSLKK